jgi:hypothetical protein
VGHRALHAVQTGDGRYDCYRTRWGGLAAFDPPGGVPGPPDADRLVAESRDAAGVISALDPGDEVLFVHGEGAYLVRRLTVPTLAERADLSRDQTAVTATALAPVADAQSARRLDADLRTAREVLADAVDAGLVPRPRAERYVRAFLARHPDARDVVWLPPDE